jgi:ADP-heptose:LPS heptosyltransferase
VSAGNWAGIARFGGVGDNLIASSVLAGLKKQYGNVEVITARPQHVVFENNPFIDKLSVRNPGDPDWGDGHSWQAWFQSRAKEYEFFANLSHTCETTGVFLKVQSAFWWRQEMRRLLADKSYLEIVHDVCGVPYAEINPNFYPTDEEKALALDTKAKVGNKVIGWVLTGTRVDKVHPQADIAMAKLLREFGVPIIMFGAPGKDFEYAKLIQKEVVKLNRSDAGLHLALSPDPLNPSWGIRRILAQAQACDLVIGPDTGPMWAVAMHAMPKVMLLSHASERNITAHWKNTTTMHADQARVPCWPCHRLHDDYTTCVANVDKNGPACLTDISVDEIFSTVVNLLKE